MNCIDRIAQAGKWWVLGEKMTLFERTKQTANEKGLSIRELETKAELPDNTIYNWKRSSPKVETVEKVADTLNVSMDYLLCNSLKGDMKPEIRRISNSMNELSSEELEHIYDMVASFLKHKK